MVIACRAPYGGGGLGRHFSEVLEAAREKNELVRYYAKTRAPGDERIGRVVSTGPLLPLMPYTPLRYSPAWKYHLSGVAFDRAVASMLRREGEVFTGFLGGALLSFRKARKLGMQQLELQAVNSHVENIRRMHVQALKAYDFDAAWLNAAHIERGLKEYAEADTIYCNSDYTLQSFLAQGHPAAILKRTYPKAHPRFQPPEQRPDDGIFRVVYTGSISVAKGVPVLIEAFNKLTSSEARLTLVGNWSTRSMRRYVEGWMARDPRIHHAPGDPLPHYHRADVCVHPSYEDGFGYAPAEALACGIPVVVTEDTGMKELVHEGENGWIIPTGSVDALYERLDALWRRR